MNTMTPFARTEAQRKDQREAALVLRDAIKLLSIGEAPKVLRRAMTDAGWCQDTIQRVAQVIERNADMGVGV